MNGPIPPNRNGSEPERDAAGRLLPGHSVSRKPHRNRMAELRRQVLETETPERVREVVAKLRELAVGGDVTACRAYLEMTLGKAPQAIALTDADGDSLLNFAQLESAILGALEPFGEKARFAVALALRGVADAGLDDR